mmetsp:Transcript_56580/g.106150  ORF Transcript_56580/g.106150 Transcript_56580/m.106150 type:complete len:233 (+) Transcript_56580:36-734(+)
MSLYQTRSCDSLVKLSGVRTQPKWSFRGKPNTDVRADTPGPGQYSSTDSVKFSTTKHGFGTSPRDIVRPATSPGPGEYTPAQTLSRNGYQYGFGTSQRQNMKSFDAHASSPGPGAYTQSPRFGREGPKYTASSKRSGYKTSDVPGPGAYHAIQSSTESTIPVRSPKWGFGTSAREGQLSGHGPGPGAYDANVATIAKGGPKYSMRPKMEMRRNMGETPGPGAYTGALTQFGY